MPRFTLSIVLLTAGVSLAQTQPQPARKTGARDLYYFGPTEKDELPPIHKSAAPPKVSTATPAPPKKAAAPAAGTPHLGLRYTLLLVKGDRQQPVDPERNFTKGECVALQFESNRTGYLYVLAKESSGNWRTLFPSAELADERNVIDPGQKVRIPQTACFEIDDPPGTESLFVALSRQPRDIAGLQDNIKGSPTQVKATVDQMFEQFGTRDLAIRKPTKAPGGPEAGEQAVYVVDTSGKSSTTVVTKVEIRHR